MTASPQTATDIAGNLAWGLPFAGLLLAFAIMPLAAPRLWHSHYGKIIAFWALAFLLPHAMSHGAAPALKEILHAALIEYLPFILLLGALFAVSGGLHVTGTPRGSPAVNTALLALGTALASAIGTTGAALVIVRPMIRANRHRRRKTHLFVFFILLVANAGGALTPLGDPPLFLGYLRGVPFFWSLRHLFLPTVVVAGGLLGMFYLLDSYVMRRDHRKEPPVLVEIEKLGIRGRVNLVLLAAVIATVLLRGFWHPALGITILGVAWGVSDIVTDALLALIGGLSVILTSETCRRANEFSWGPMIEVAILFAGIFVTLIPVQAMIEAGANGPAAPVLARLFSDGVPNDRLFFWATGLLSAFLDNAPTYLVFFDFAGGDARELAGPAAQTLAAISMAAVYFGALTYLGNAPNLMIKALCESHGIRMPSFFAYIGWAALCLLPWLLLVEMLFFR